MALLEVDHLSVAYAPHGRPPTHAVRDVTFTVDEGEFVGLLGESGGGKTTLGNAILRLLTPPARITGGTVRFAGADLATLPPEKLRALRWAELATVFQSSMNSLNPVLRVAAQFADTFAAHGVRGEVPERATELLRMVSLEPRVLRAYPHELSGGMRQRVALALALALRPRLVLLDEPTTGLDVVLQRDILDRLRALRTELGFAVLHISHDLGAVLELADRVLVMHGGEIVEQRPARDLLTDPRHPYSRRLVDSYAALRGARADRPPTTTRPPDAPPALVVHDVTMRYTTRRNLLRRTVTDAVRGVSLELRRGGVTALVGQSGSGKSTLARLITGVERPSTGSIHFGDTRVDRLRARARRDYHRHVQLVFQDPFSALNPSHTVAYALSRPLANFARLRGAAGRDRAARLLESVGLSPAVRFLDKLPHQLSGGQRQRVVIARALAPEPAVLVADEPVSMLDTPIRAEILDLLATLVRTRDLALLYITHDLLSARLLADEILVLQHGTVVEHGPTHQLLAAPRHPYTRLLLDSVPNPFPAPASRAGGPPSG